MKLVSASNAEAFSRCTASHVLPQHESYQDQNEKGTSNHHLLAEAVNGVPGGMKRLEETLPGLYPKLLEYMTDIDNPACEDAYVIDVQSRKSLYVGRNINRKYEEALGRKLHKYEICTSLDLRARTVGGVPWIRDFKFGVYSSWWQLYIQAMAVLWGAGPTGDFDVEVDAGFLHIEDRDGEELEIYDDTAALYLSDLDDRADELMTAFGRAESLERQMASGTHYSDLKVIEGKWCQYCGAFPNCPAKWKLAKSMLDLDVVNHIGALTREQCGDAWTKLAEVKKNIIKPMEEALKLRMEKEKGFPAGDGKVFRLVTMPGRTTIKKEHRLELLRVFPNADDYFTKGEEYTQVFKKKE